MTLHDLIQKSDSGPGRAFDLAIIALILLSIIAITVETWPGLSPVTLLILHWSEVAITLLFTVEYLLRVYTAPSKSGYAFSFYGLIDLLAVLPFYLSLGVDLRGLRAFRVLRVFRILKITRYNRAMARFRRALVLAREELVLFMVTTLIVLYPVSYTHLTLPTIYSV